MTDKTKADTKPKADQASDDLATIGASSIKEFNPFLKELERLKLQYGAVVYDVTIAESFEDAKKARKDIREVRYSAQKAATEIIKPYQQTVKDAQEKVRQAKAIGEELIEKVMLLEQPIDDQIKAEEKRIKDEKERLEEIERQRIAGIQDKISHFRNVSVVYGTRSAADIGAMLERVKAAVLSEETYGEFEGEATIARDSAVVQLETLHKLAVDREAEAERVERERKELDELREKNRIAEETAQRERDQRAKEDQERLNAQKAEMKRQQDEMDAERERMNKEKAELELLRKSAPAVVVPAVAAPAVEAIAPVEPIAPVATATVEAQSDAATEQTPDNMPAFDAIAEVVAFGFDVSISVASDWLRRINA